MAPQYYFRIAAVLCCISSLCAANEQGIVNPASESGPQSELHIARLVFDTEPYSHWGPGRPWWRIDWPEAEKHLTEGIGRYTVIEAAADSVHLTLNDDAVFDYPWLFAQQVGHWQLSTTEVLRLREYLQRGGFLVVDDFHGPVQWRIFTDVMNRVLPEYTISDIAANDPLLSILYELDQRTQIPGRRHIMGIKDTGDAIVRMPHSPPRWRGIHDSEGRLLVAINFNMDMGDSWEHANDPGYPLPMTSFGYRLAINYIVYAMTH